MIEIIFTDEAHDLITRGRFKPHRPLLRGQDGDLSSRVGRTGREGTFCAEERLVVKERVIAFAPT